MEQCDATASPNDELPFENGVQSSIRWWSDDSYSDSSDSNSSSLHEVRVCALNEKQNVDLTTKRGNRNQRAEEEKEPFNRNGKEIKPNYYEIQNTHAENFKGVSEILERSIRPLVGPLVYWNIFLNSSSRKHLIFQRYRSVGDISAKINFILLSMKSLTAKYREQLWGKESTVTTVMHFVSMNVTWIMGCAVTCLATVDVTNRHIRAVIWQTKGGLVSSDKQARNTRQARDSSRCSNSWCTFWYCNGHSNWQWLYWR